MHTLTDSEAATVADLLYDALVTTRPDQWSDYGVPLGAFIRLASKGRLEAFLFDCNDEIARDAVTEELTRREIGSGNAL